MGTWQETNIAPIQLVIMSVSVTVTVIDIIKVVSTFLLDLSFVFCTPTYLHKGDTTSSDHQQQSLFSISILHLINHILFLISQNFNHISIYISIKQLSPKFIPFSFFIPIYLFQAIPQIKTLANDPTHKNHYHLLELFAHGTYKDYISDESKFPSNLSPLILKKLKMLSVVTMGSANKNLEYDVLMKSLDLNDVRELEDLLIECIYAGIIVGRLDQQKSQLKIERVAGRDPSDLDIANMCEKLEKWGLAVENMIEHVDSEAKIATDIYDMKKLKINELKENVSALKSEKEVTMGGNKSSAISSNGGWAGNSVTSERGGDDMAAALAASRVEF